MTVTIKNKIYVAMLAGGQVWISGVPYRPEALAEAGGEIVFAEPKEIRAVIEAGFEDCLAVVLRRT